MLVCGKQGQCVLQTAESDLSEVMENQADSWELGKGNGKKSNLGYFYLAILTSVLNTARG